MGDRKEAAQRLMRTIMKVESLQRELVPLAPDLLELIEVAGEMPTGSAGADETKRFATAAEKLIGAVTATLRDQASKDTFMNVSIAVVEQRRKDRHG